MPERVDTGALPETEPHALPIFDTGPHPEPLRSAVALEPAPDLDEYNPYRITHGDLSTPKSDPIPVPATSLVLPGRYRYLKRWKFALTVLAVWIPAAALGLGLYYSWFHALDKTWPEFAVLLYLVVSVVTAMLVTMVDRRPTVTATGLAVLSAPFASGLAAAALYGMYVFGWVAP